MYQLPRQWKTTDHRAGTLVLEGNMLQGIWIWKVHPNISYLDVPEKWSEGWKILERLHSSVFIFIHSYVYFVI